jgi:cell division protein FtsQ
LLAAVFTLLMLSPLFLVKSTDITIKRNLKGNSNISQESVISALGLDKPQNMFLISTSRAKSVLRENKYLRSVKIEKQFPNKILVSLDEYDLSGYVPYLNSFLCIDSDGLVITTTDTAAQDIPIIEGLSFNSFCVGQPLQTANANAITAVVKVVRLLQKYNDKADSCTVSAVNVASVDDIHLFVNNIDIEFGPLVDADEKIRTMDAIIAKLPNNDTIHGVLDMRVIGQKYIFKILT